MKVVKSRSVDSIRVDISLMPEYQADAMCRTLTGCISRFFENAENAAEYARWKEEYKRKDQLKCQT